jgi:hypothetical protein
MKVTLVKSGSVYRVKGKKGADGLPKSITFDVPKSSKGTVDIEIWSGIANPEVANKLEALLKRKA